MKLIDRLILKEIVGPWVFGVGLFSALLIAGTLLNKIADYVVQGAPVGLILQLVGLLLPGILVKTFTMSVLLAGLLSFGRLSSDSEIVALKAGGASVVRIIRPVMVFSMAIAVATFLFNEFGVPSAANRSRQLLVELANSKGKREGDPIAFPQTEKGKLVGYVMAKAINPAAQRMREVTIVAYDKDGAVSHYLNAPELTFNPVTLEWRIRGESHLLDAKGRYVLRTSEAWPEQVHDIKKTLDQLLLNSNTDPDLRSMSDLRKDIEEGWANGDVPMARLRNWEYWYWNKISVPLAAFIFGTLGAVLGIRDHRTGTATGFALAVGIIFVYWSLANFMNVWAQGGVLPPWLASFLPLVLGSVASAIIMLRRNT